MSVFKCKMCGGTLEFNEGDTVAVCDSCGSRQTLPRLDDEKRANMYDRANHFRRNNEFDKAMGIYEQILNEDKTDAESYWSLVLCRYGIEYVEDPSTHKRVPTVNRAQFTSIFDDDNYKSAIKYADGSQRAIYEEEAKAINEIQKGILAISQKEQPFDIFICYKETDESGRRTRDSVLANDLYHQLTQEGFKVFFSRITLEDKLGCAYEPYIFAALNSSKVMVVIGTKPEYFNAVWVKNEWSRYLALIKGGAKKALIPAYRDMDPYDLPEEFSHLQAQDMSKLGFMQDLIRGIKKIVDGDKKPEPKAVAAVQTGGETSPLLKRAFMFLEDGNWQEADAYCEKVLDSDPECAQGYLGKLMAELRVNKIEDLKNCDEPFDESDNYVKAVRFADDKLKEQLQGYIKYINERNENERLEGIYQSAAEKMNYGYNHDDSASYIEAQRLLESIPGYRDSDELAKKCPEFVEVCKKNKQYLKANNLYIRGSVSDVKLAIDEFEKIRDWKDSAEKIELCKAKIEQLNKKHEEDVKAAKKSAIEVGIFTAVTALVIAFVVLLNFVIIPSVRYNNAKNLLAEKKYAEAGKAFKKLGDYKDSEKMPMEIKYLKAMDLFDEQEYTKAANMFSRLCDYKDSKELSNESRYNNAIKMLDEGSYTLAYTMFGLLGEFKDSPAKLIEAEKGILQTAAVGKIVRFADEDWRVIDRSGNRLLLISEKNIADKEYNKSNDNVTWETCTLRKWLNNDWLSSAFSDGERAMIEETTVKNPDNPEYGTKGGNDTVDKVFLLSIDEANKYFLSDADRMNGSWWWLRSPGHGQGMVACVYGNGGVYSGGNYEYRGGRIDTDGYSVNRSDNGVRPAMWIKVE